MLLGVAAGLALLMALAAVSRFGWQDSSPPEPAEESGEGAVAAKELLPEELRQATPPPRDEKREEAVQQPPPAEPDRPQVQPTPSPAAPHSKHPDRKPGQLKRRRVIPEEELRDQLALVPEAGLRLPDIRTLMDTYDAHFRLTAPDFQPTLLLQVRPDLASFPLRTGSAVQLDPAAAATLGTLSRKLHAYVDSATPKDVLGQRVDPSQLRQLLRLEKRGRRPEWLRPEAVPVLRQILSHEQTPLRHLLIELLAEVPHRRSSELLAERAVFDLTPEVRAAAVAGLHARPREEFRHVFLNAMRFPWAPAADHAAEALAALDDRDAVPSLVALLKLPDPSAPYPGARGGEFQRELVRVNHLSNCLMCHVPAQTLQDPVIGLVPGVQRRVVGGYGGRQTSRGSSPLWVRADVRFFRQDFAESLAVGPPNMPGRPTFRFDYLVRNRALAPKDAKRLKEHYDQQPSYDQREAVLFALRELTGQDPGPKYEAWLALYPTAELDAEAARLTDRLVQAPADQRDAVLARLRDGKGSAFTLALARAIPKLSGIERDRARDALARRLAGSAAEDLRELLHDEDAEVRRAAAAACLRKNDPALVPDLIPLLRDDQAAVAAQARASLKGVTGQDLGDSAAAWETWWQQR